MRAKNVAVFKSRTIASIVQNIQQSLNDGIAGGLADTPLRAISGEMTTFLINDGRTRQATTSAGKTRWNLRLRKVEAPS